MAVVLSDQCRPGYRNYIKHFFLSFVSVSLKKSCPFVVCSYITCGVFFVKLATYSTCMYQSIMCVCLCVDYCRISAETVCFLSSFCKRAFNRQNWMYKQELIMF